MSELERSCQCTRCGAIPRVNYRMSAKGVLPSDWSCYACLSEAEQVQIDEETREFAKLIVNTFNPQPL